MSFLRCISIIFISCVILSSITLAEDTVIDKESPSCYAIFKINGKNKLCTEGDIFYSQTDIAHCIRIQEIKKDIVTLRDVNREDIFIIKPGERILLEGSEIIFEKTIEKDIIKYER